MIPVALRLHNFMSYRAPTAVDFSGIRTACLSGDNGAGKSALLEAMTWAVWGKTRAANARDAITMGESQMEVTFDFRLAGREYRIFRRRSWKPGAGSALEFYVREIGAEDWLSITADSIPKTDAKIVETLRMDYETFTNSAFLMQGKADTFTGKPPGERKRVLADILNLGDYDILNTLARDEEKALRGQVSYTRNRVSQLEEQLIERPRVEAQLERLSAELVVTSARVEEFETGVQALQDQFNALGALIGLREATSTRLQSTTVKLSTIRKLLGEDRAALATLETLIQRGDEIESGYGELVKWRETADSWAAVLRHRQPLEELLHSEERALEHARGNVQREHDRFDSGEQQARKALAQLDARQAELTPLLVAARNDRDVSTRLDHARAELRKHEAAKAALETECAALKTQMHEIKQHMELLATGDAECPICRRPITDGEHEHVSELWTSEGKRLGDRYRAHGKRIKEVDLRLIELNHEVKVLEATNTSATQRSVVIQRIETELEARERIEKDSTVAADEAARLSAQLEENTFAPELVEAISKTAVALSKLAYDSNQANEAAQRIAELLGFEREHQELQTARLRYSTLQQTIADREAGRADLEAEVEALEQELSDIRVALEGEPELRARLATSRDELDRAQAERDTLQNSFGAVQNKMEHLDRLAEEHERLKADLGTLGLDADTYKELVVAFGRNGIQAMIIETILPELEDETNRLLARMANSQLHVDFRSTRQAVSNESIIETLDIIIRDEAGERPYALYSGGESFRVDFAIRVALSKLLVRRAGATIDMLIIDEGFGTQDTRGREGLIEALQSVESDFETILVITHIDEVRDMFPTRIEVTKTDAGSQVAVI